MKRFVGLILPPDAQADLTRRIDAMDLGKLEGWHAFILARLSNASAWEDYEDYEDYEGEQ